MEKELSGPGPAPTNSRQLSHADAAPPKLPRVEELHPGLFRIRMQLPFAPRIVNIWLLQDEKGWVLIDAGLDTPESRTVLSGVLACLGNPKIRSVVVTHAHADHGGLAGWVCRETGAMLMMSRVEWLQARLTQINQDVAVHEHFIRMAGAPDNWLMQVAGHRAWMASQFAELSSTFCRLAHGDGLAIGGRDWTVLTGGGHASEQIALYCPAEKILIGADHLLPLIVPALPARPEEFLSDPFKEAFASLDMMMSLPEDTRVLPSHGEPFAGIRSRIAAVRGSYHKRLGRIRDLAVKPVSAYDCLSLIPSRDISFASMRIPIAEAFAALHHLEVCGHLASVPDENGVPRFSSRQG